ncbi:MAG: sigma-54-dependent Fis family transcriptional regulator [Bacteroidales bacterium]|nr:sigma-54-dependent Fis family transcriptional regulator [Bacteroidales bacterium]
MVLVVDDDKAVRSSLKLLLKQAGYGVETLAGPQEALEWIRQQAPRLVLMDMNFSSDTSGREGIELLQKVRVFHPEVPVILITGWGTIELAVEGIKKGANDFITKPWDNHHLLESIRTHLMMHTSDAVSMDRRQLERQMDLSGIMGEDPVFLELLNAVGKVAPTEATVLIRGESGSGKELIAEAIHNNSRRKDQPFIKVNLGGIATSLFESEMFGHRKGAFTDAKNDRKGRFGLAEGGTIFLDEIAELEPASQVKLLRVLQERQYEVLGDSQTRRANVRVICATNRDLGEMVAQGLFREDLYYRINLINLQVPSLRERVSDIPRLAEFFVRQVCLDNNLAMASLGKDAAGMLKKYAFPGNIRELKNLVQRTVLLASGPELTEANFQTQIEKQQPVYLNNKRAGLQTLDGAEKQLIEETLDFYKGNLSQAARSLGLSRGALYRRLEKYNIHYES